MKGARRTTPKATRKAATKASARQANSSLRWRFMLVFWAGCACVLVGRAVQLQVVQHDFLADQGDIRNLRVEPVAAHRGVIQDRAGRPLAVSTPVTTLWANPGEALEHQEQWARLGNNPIIDSRACWRFAERGSLYLSTPTHAICQRGIPWVGQAGSSGVPCGPTVRRSAMAGDESSVQRA